MLLLTYKLYLRSTAANHRAPRTSSQALTLSHVSVTASQTSNKLWRSGWNDNEVPSKWAATGRPLLLGRVHGVQSSTQEGLRHSRCVMGLRQIKKALDLAGQQTSVERLTCPDGALWSLCNTPLQASVIRSKAPPTFTPPIRLNKHIS